MANETATIPDKLRAKAQEKNWPEDLVLQALGAGATRGADHRLHGPGRDGGAGTRVPRRAGRRRRGALGRGDGEGCGGRLAGGPRAAGARRRCGRGGPDPASWTWASRPTRRASSWHRAAAARRELDLSWMQVPTEWDTRAKPTKHGLTLEAINIGKYGDVPDVWAYQTEMPRGAVPIAGVESMGYSIFQKQEVWSDACAPLYEEAIQRRWRPATDVPWDSIEPLPDDLERGDLPGLHAHQREGADGGRHHRPLGAGDQLRLPRSEALSCDDGLRERARRRGLPQASALERRRPGRAVAGLGVPLGRRRAELHRDARSCSIVLAGQPDAGAVPVRREVREERGREVHLRPRDAGQGPASSPTASRTSSTC